MIEEHKQFDFKSTNDDFLPPEDVLKDWASVPGETYTLKNMRVRRTFYVDDKEVNFLKGQRLNRMVTSANYSVAVTDFLIAVTNLAVARTIELPSPKTVNMGKSFIVKDEAGGATTTAITIRSTGDANIDGAATSTLTTNYQAKRFYTDQTQWFTF